MKKNSASGQPKDLPRPWTRNSAFCGIISDPTKFLGTSWNYVILFISVMDAEDPHRFWSAGSGSESRRAKITDKKEKVKTFHVFKCWMFFLRAGASSVA
jgi:hypothetical protein